MGHHVVDVWWSDLRVMDLGLRSLLDPVEERRANGIDRAADLGRFVVGAVLLRVAVAAATGLDPRAVSIDRTCDECGSPHGRPRVPDLHVSVAHAGPLVLVAASPVPVGVDVEAVERGPDIAQWVREEATFKATGERRARASVVELQPPLGGHLAALAALAAVDGAEVEVTVHPTAASARALAEVTRSADAGQGSARLMGEAGTSHQRELEGRARPGSS